MFGPRPRDSRNYSQLDSSLRIVLEDVFDVNSMSIATSFDYRHFNDMKLRTKGRKVVARLADATRRGRRHRCPASDALRGAQSQWAGTRARQCCRERARARWQRKTRYEFRHRADVTFRRPGA